MANDTVNNARYAPNWVGQSFGSDSTIAQAKT